MHKLLRSGHRFLLVFGICGLLACRSTAASDTRGLAASKTAKNIALLFAGLSLSDQEDADNSENLFNMEEFLKDATKDQVGTFEVRKFDGATKPTVLWETEKALSELDEDGTLFWFVGTHGWTDGFATYPIPTVMNRPGPITSSVPNRVRPHELMEAMRRGRSGKSKIKRLMMFFDYCGSGGAVQRMQLTDAGDSRPKKRIVAKENVVINMDHMSPELRNRVKRDETPAKAMAEMFELAPMPRRLPDSIYEQALFFAVADIRQEVDGGSLAAAVTAVLQKARLSDPDMTIKQFIEGVTEYLLQNYETNDYEPDNVKYESNVPQRAIYKSLPDERMLSDYVFK